MAEQIDREALHKQLVAFGRRNMRTSQQEFMEGHMVRLFEEVLSFKPELIVELGVGWGCSGFALGKAAEICGARMFSVDVRACKATVELRLPPNVQFVQMDDVEFARAWDLGSIIDILMIDTLHNYDQIQAEVEAWFPHLRQRCKLIFHDTNARPYFEAVARFLRDWLKIPFPEGEAFVAEVGEWNIRHYPESNGLTIFDRGET